MFIKDLLYKSNHIIILFQIIIFNIIQKFFYKKWILHREKTHQIGKYYIFSV